MTTPAASMKVLEAIRGAYAATTRAPTIGELQKALGYSSKTTVVFHLNRLVEDGWIRRDPGVSRGIVLLEPTPEDGDQP